MALDMFGEKGSESVLEKFHIHRRKGMRTTYQRLNQMIDEAMEGSFQENDYDETELSKLEVKWKRFLTSARLSNQELEEERKNIKELVSDISHQTKTPLANILLYSQLLEEQNLDETSKNLVSEIAKQSEKLDFLIQSLVKTSRLETGTFQFHPQKQEVFEMLQEVAEQVTLKAKKKKMEISIQKTDMFVKQDTSTNQVPDRKLENGQITTNQIPDKQKQNEQTEYSGIQAVYDKKWTSEAFYNILDNAVKYGNEESLVQITVKAYEMFVCMTVCNEGTGISEEEIPLIFQRFYRGKNASEAEGVGIGLYLVRQIIEEQGGYIKVDSKEGEKTKFSVYLPKER